MFHGYYAAIEKKVINSSSSEKYKQIRAIFLFEMLWQARNLKNGFIF